MCEDHLFIVMYGFIMSKKFSTTNILSWVILSSALYLYHQVVFLVCSSPGDNQHETLTGLWKIVLIVPSWILHSQEYSECTYGLSVLTCVSLGPGSPVATRMCPLLCRTQPLCTVCTLTETRSPLYFYNHTSGAIIICSTGDGKCLQVMVITCTCILT